MGNAFTSWLLFLVVLVNQAGRVMIPSVMTAVMSDEDMPVDAAVRGLYLSLVSAVCLGGKFLGGAITDSMGGWVILIAVFGMFAVSSSIMATCTSANTFGGMWLINSLAYTLTWGAACQVVGVAFEEKERPAQLAKIASASRCGASLGSMLFGLLLKYGLTWRMALLPAIPMQVLLALICAQQWIAFKPGKGNPRTSSAVSEPQRPSNQSPNEPSPWMYVMSLNFWLMFIPKVVIFTYTQVSLTRAACATAHSCILRVAELLQTRFFSRVPPSPSCLAVFYEFHRSTSALHLWL